MMTDPILELWTSQAVAPVQLAPEALAARAHAFDRRVRMRNAREYAAGAVLIPVFGAIAVLQPDWLLRLACVVIVVGVVVVIRGIHVRGHAARADDWTAPMLDHHRIQLVRQRDALAGVWRWYLAPLVPGLALFFAAVWRSIYLHAGASAATARIVPAVLIAIVAFAGIHWLNRVAARRLTRAIAALDHPN